MFDARDSGFGILRQKSGRGSELKVSREVGRQKQTQGLRNYPKFWVEITGLKNHIGDPRIGLSQFQKLSLPHEIKSTSFQVKISLNSTTTSKTAVSLILKTRPEATQAIRYTCSMNSYLTCDSKSEISAAQLRSVTEIAPKSPFLCVKRGPI